MLSDEHWTLTPIRKTWLPSRSSSTPSLSRILASAHGITVFFIQWYIFYYNPMVLRCLIVSPPLPSRLLLHMSLSRSFWDSCRQCRSVHVICWGIGTWRGRSQFTPLSENTQDCCISLPFRWIPSTPSLHIWLISLSYRDSAGWYIHYALPSSSSSLQSDCWTVRWKIGLTKLAILQCHHIHFGPFNHSGLR